MDLGKRAVEGMLRSMRDKEDRAFFGSVDRPDLWSSSYAWASSSENTLTSQDLLDFFKRQRMTPWERRADDIEAAMRALMLKNGFDPDVGDICLVDFSMTLFWTKLTRDHLPEWIREMPFPGGGTAVWLVKLSAIYDVFPAWLESNRR